MRIRATVLTLIFASATVALANPPLTRGLLVAAAQESANDNISSGWCGRGMLSILKSIGLGDKLKGGNGQDWEQNLMQAGWRPVRCLSPLQAPLGSVLVYMSDTRVGKRQRGTPGGYYGHVEMVALAPNGQRLYVSDSPRPKPGGSVPDNFTGRAWMPPGQFRVKTLPVEQLTDNVLQERKRMALEYFSKRGQNVSATTLTLNTVD